MLRLESPEDNGNQKENYSGRTGLGAVLAAKALRDTEAYQSGIDINHQRLDKAISRAIQGYGVLHGVHDGIPNLEQINNALGPDAKARFDKMIDEYGDSVFMVLSRTMSAQEMIGLGTHIGFSAKGVLEDYYDGQEPNWKISLINMELEPNNIHELPKGAKYGHPSVDALAELFLEARKRASMGCETGIDRFIGYEGFTKLIWTGGTKDEGLTERFVFSVNRVKTRINVGLAHDPIGRVLGAGSLPSLTENLRFDS